VELGEEGNVYPFFNAITSNDAGTEGLRLGEVYPRYCNRLTAVCKDVNEAADCDSQFAELLHTTSYTILNTGEGDDKMTLDPKGLGFSAHFIRPVQKLVGYSMLLGRLLKVMMQEEDHPQMDQLQAVQEAIQKSQHEVDASAKNYSALAAIDKQISNSHLSFADEQRSLVKRGDMWLSSEDVLATKHDAVTVFLLSDRILIAVKEDLSTDDGMLRVKHSLDVAAYECVPTSGQTFTLNSPGGNKIDLRAFTVQKRDKWVDCINATIADAKDSMGL